MLKWQHGHFHSCIKLSSYRATAWGMVMPSRSSSISSNPWELTGKTSPTGRGKLLKHGAHLLLLLGSQWRLLILRSLAKAASFVWLVIQEVKMVSQRMLSYSLWLNFDHTVPTENGTLLDLPFYHLVKLLQALIRSSSHAVQPHWSKICLIIS